METIVVLVEWWRVYRCNRDARSLAAEQRVGSDDESDKPRMSCRAIEVRLATAPLVIVIIIVALY